MGTKSHVMAVKIMDRSAEQPTRRT